MKNSGYFTLFPLPLQVRLTGDVYEHADGNERAHQICPPIADEWKRQPFCRKQPCDNAHIEQRLEENEKSHAERHQLPKTIRSLGGNDHSAHEHRNEQGQQKQRKSNAPLLCANRKYEVGVVLRKIELLLHRIAEPDPHLAAVADGDQRLMQLMVGLMRILS